MQINPKFVWDYDIPDDKRNEEAFQRWYLARVLSRGSLSDIHAVGLETIRQVLPSLVLPVRVKQFWDYYFKLLDQAA